MTTQGSVLTAAKIAFIGGGNMARSIIGGLIRQGYAADQITASAPTAVTRDALAADFGIRVTAENCEACSTADLLVLAVKPQLMASVCQGLKPTLGAKTLVISVAAGITCATIKKHLHADTPLVRCMPNTPALVRRGVSGMFASKEVDARQKATAEAVLAAVGQVYWLDYEAQLDAVTAVSGSGPAYFFMFMEAMVEAGNKMGLPAEMAKAMAIETAAGAAELAAGSDLGLGELRRRVTSPGGTTERAVAVFEARQLGATVQEAMEACALRAKTLAEQLSQ